MTSKSIATEEWTCFYDAVNQLSAVRKNSQLVSEYGYDGDGKRVWAIDYESSVAQKETIYIGNYFEFVREDEAAGQGEGAICESPDYCTYLPMIFQMPRGISYYYADGQRIAMRDKNGVVSYLYGDQLGGVSAVADASGNLVSTTLYEPWGATRYENGDNITEYGYTGQMQEGDIYFYNARWYDPSIGRFMQADTIIPLQVQGTQAFDRYAYVNNNPINYVDPGGDFAITTAILIGVGVGALAGYAGQVIHNLNNNMSFKEALTTDISAGWIIGGAVAGGVLGGAGFAALSHFGIISTASATTAATSGVCADGDCGNEIRTLTESGLNTIDEIANSEIGQNLARAFTHNSTSQTVSIGSYDDYLIVGKNMDYTFFDMPGKVWEILRGFPDIYWKGINTAYVNQQIAAGKEFVTAISDPLRIGQGTLLELNILRNSGYIENFLSPFHQTFRIY